MFYACRPSGSSGVRQGRHPAGTNRGGLEGLKYYAFLCKAMLYSKVVKMAGKLSLYHKDLWRAKIIASDFSVIQFQQLSANAP